MFLVEKKWASAARRALCKVCERVAMAVGEKPRPLRVSWPFSRWWPGPEKMVSMKAWSLTCTSCGVILTIGPGDVSCWKRGQGGGSGTVFLVHFLDLPDVLATAD